MLFIAEIGLNHNGNFSLAYEMIRQAKAAGADVAKFQLGWRDKEGELNRITPEILDNIFRWCDYIEIEPLVSIFTPEAWEMARTRPFKRFKIASRTVIDQTDLARAILAEGKETFVSLGMWNQDGLPFNAPNARYLWCRSLYPTAPWDLTDLPKDFSKSPYVGYSDHFLGIESPWWQFRAGPGSSKNTLR